MAVIYPHILAKRHKTRPRRVVGVHPSGCRQPASLVVPSPRGLYVKEEIAMREIRVSSPLTVYHDGQFWVGMFERIEEGRLSACRVVFGAEPSAKEFRQLVCERAQGRHARAAQARAAGAIREETGKAQA